jgi:hypothetical protein
MPTYPADELFHAAERLRESAAEHAADQHPEVARAALIVAQRYEALGYEAFRRAQDERDSTLRRSLPGSLIARAGLPEAAGDEYALALAFPAAEQAREADPFGELLARIHGPRLGPALKLPELRVPPQAAKAAAVSAPAAETDRRAAERAAFWRATGLEILELLAGLLGALIVGHIFASLGRWPFYLALALAVRAWLRQGHAPSDGLGDFPRPT